MAAEAKSQGGALQVITSQHVGFDQVRRAEVVKSLEAMLEPDKTGLTLERLINDLAAYISSTAGRPKGDLTLLMDPVGIYICLYAACTNQCSFGDGGLWVIPEGSKLRPQASEKLNVRRAQELSGCKILPPILVYKADEPVKVEKNDLAEIVSVTLNTDKFTAPRPQSDLVGAFGKVERPDGSVRIRWFTRSEIEQFRAHSASFQAGGTNPWATDFEAMASRSVRAAMAREIAPIRTKIAGVMGDALAPIEITPDMITEGESKPVGQTAQLIQDLKAKPEAGPTPAAATNPAATAEPGEQEAAIRKAMFDAKKAGGTAALGEYWKANNIEIKALGTEAAERLYAHLNELRQARQEDLV